MRKFRLLTKDEIECRISEVDKYGNGVKLLLYKTARTDAALLDETVGTFGWTNDFKVLDGKLYGGIGIQFDNVFLWRWDCGTESNVEAEKGQASDAFKRAGFKWGIGAELYTCPRIFISSEKCNIKSYRGADGKDKYKCYDEFSVEKIAYDESGNIIAIAIRNDTMGRRVFVWQKSTTS